MTTTVGIGVSADVAVEVSLRCHRVVVVVVVVVATVLLVLLLLLNEFCKFKLISLSILFKPLSLLSISILSREGVCDSDDDACVIVTVLVVAVVEGAAVNRSVEEEEAAVSVAT